MNEPDPRQRDRMAAMRQVFAAIEANHDGDVARVNTTLRGMGQGTFVSASLMTHEVMALALADRMGVQFHEMLAQVQQRVMLDLEYRGGTRD